MVEEVHDAEIVEDNFDPVEARRVLAKVNEALAGWIGSTVHLADVIYEATKATCWRVDEDYRAGIASGTIVPDAVRGQQSTWLGWKFNRTGRGADFLADYGEMRAVIAADPSLPPIGEPEFVARPFVAKLLKAPLRGHEQRDDDARHEAIRSVWRIATTRTDGDIRRAMAEALRPVVLKQVDYGPFRRIASPSPGQVAELRRKRIAAAVKQLRKAGETLLSLGAVEQYDSTIAELAETRARALRS